MTDVCLCLYSCHDQYLLQILWLARFHIHVRRGSCTVLTNLIIL